ncbi:MAG: tetratricopeptide repeat protein [Acidobacteria bacterium]|nr:tetratricopeptide repeat protein [Acidobacteriota bacterium]MBI3424001.1 tetratricopeptide repeat protein [Acidobacteriota bacterium]
MKTCPTCHTQYPDQLAFCQRDGARLQEIVQPPPPSFSAPTTQPVQRAVPLSQPTNRIEIATQRVEPALTIQQPVQPTAQNFAPATEAWVAPVVTTAGSKTWLWLLLSLALVAIIAAATAFYFFTNSTQSKFTQAIQSGKLVSPAGTSAYDLYQELKREGKTPEQLAEFTKPLVPQLTAKPQQLFADIAAPGKRDAPAEAWEEAQRMLAWASEIQPTDKHLVAQASYAAGRAAYLRGEKDKALEWWKKAYDQDRTWFLPANGLGIIYNERKNYVAARAVLQEALKREPDSALPYNNLGTAWLLAKDDTQAEENYNKAIERAPNWPRPHAWLGEIAMRRKDYARAVQEFELVLSLGATTDSSIDSNKIRQQLEQARKLMQEPSVAPTPPPPPPPPD